MTLAFVVLVLVLRCQTGSCSNDPTPESDERWFLFPFITTTEKINATEIGTSKLPGSVVPPSNLSTSETKELLLECRDQNTQGIYGSFIADDFLSLTSHKHNVRDNLTLESINDQLEELELWYKWKYNGHSLRFVTQGIVPHTIENSDKFEVTKDKKVKLRNKIYVSDISYDPRHYYPSRPSIFVYSVDSTGLLIPICMIRMMVKLLEMCEFAIPLLTDLDWYFIPVGNPDGYYYNTVTLPNLDGKNRERVPLRLNRNPTERNCESQYCAGVNIDRNFDFHWKSGKNCSTVGSEERARCLQENPGNQPFSERESNGFKRYLNAKENVFKVFIQLESTYPQEKPAIVFPWAYSADTPSNYNDLLTYANNARDIIKETTGVDYEVYQASKPRKEYGTIMDWIMAKLKSKYVFKIKTNKGLAEDENLGLSSEVHCDELEYAVFGIARQYLEEEVKRNIYDMSLVIDPYANIIDPSGNKNLTQLFFLNMILDKYEKISKEYQELGFNMVDTLSDTLKEFTKNLKEFSINEI